MRNRQILGPETVVGSFSFLADVPRYSSVTNPDREDYMDPNNDTARRPRQSRNGGT